MLAIRLKRTGRSGHAQFRVIVQDSQFSPKRGRVVSYLGSYDPHTKSAQLDSEKAAKYLENGAQPSDTVARLFKKEGIKLPGWVKLDEPKKRTVRNPEKRRSTAPAKPAEPTPPAEPAAEPEPAQEAQAEVRQEPVAESSETAEATTKAPAETAEEVTEVAAEEPAAEAPPAEEPAAIEKPESEEKAKEKPSKS